MRHHAQAPPLLLFMRARTLSSIRRVDGCLPACRSVGDVPPRPGCVMLPRMGRRVAPFFSSLPSCTFRSFLPPFFLLLSALYVRLHTLRGGGSGSSLCSSSDARLFSWPRGCAAWPPLAARPCLALPCFAFSSSAHALTRRALSWPCGCAAWLLLAARLRLALPCLSFSSYAHAQMRRA